MKTKLRRITGSSIAVILLLAIYYLSYHIGYNETESVYFRFYYHTDYKPKDVRPGNYFILEMPENELYRQGTKIVKRVACTEGLTLKTFISDDEAFNFYCDGSFIGKLSNFFDSRGNRLKTFFYDGVIPKGYVFLLGDLDKSYDSRYWGLLPVSNLKRLVYPISFVKQAEAAATDYDIIKDRGFYRYEEPKVQEEIGDNSTKDNGTLFVMPQIPGEQELSVMPPEKFAKLFKDVQDYTMSYRTLENFDKYAKLRAVMFKRSMEFMNVGTLWGQLNPEDSSETWFPTSGFGQASYKAQTDEIRSSYIQSNSEDFGLLYFYRTDCAYCAKQEPLISYFEEMSGWQVKRVNVYEMPEAMGRFNVKSVPTLILVERETGRWLLVSAGLMTVEEIEERIYRTIKYLKGESNEKDFSNPIRPDTLVNK